MKKVPYSEGSWFAVPLRTGGFGVGVVARMGRRGVTLGYFFGPVRRTVPRLDEVRELHASEAVLVARFGDLGLIEGSWPIIGRSADWDRSEWPLPGFGRRFDFTGQGRRIEYSEKDLLTETREVPISNEELERLPEDGSSGAGAIETVLTKLLLGAQS